MYLPVKHPSFHNQQQRSLESKNVRLLKLCILVFKKVLILCHPLLIKLEFNKCLLHAY